MGVFNHALAAQKFNARRRKKGGGYRSHKGIDLGTGGRKGLPVGCPLDGFKVESVRRRSGYGNTVDLISFDGKTRMRFAHLANPLPKHLKVGQPVQKGDWLGDVGNTGGKYAIHLHFEYHVNKGKGLVPVNPFGNEYHKFSRQDFEETTKMAYASRSAVRNGTAKPVSMQDIAFEEKANADTKKIPVKPTKGSLATPAKPKTTKEQPINTQPKDREEGFEDGVKEDPVWTLERGFDQPNWWERNMPVFLGGWSKERLEEAERQRKLDEEVFKGVKRRDLLEQGVTNAEIEQFKTFVNEKNKTGDLKRRLSDNSYLVNLNDVYDNRQTAGKVHEAFKEIRKNQGHMS